MAGWIGVDLDGTLAHYGGWVGPDHIGEPIAPMVERIKRWLAEGKEAKIFTARVVPQGHVAQLALLLQIFDIVSQGLQEKQKYIYSCQGASMVI